MERWRGVAAVVTYRRFAGHRKVSKRCPAALSASSAKAARSSSTLSWGRKARSVPLESHFLQGGKTTLSPMQVSSPCDDPPTSTHTHTPHPFGAFMNKTTAVKNVAHLQIRALRFHRCASTALPQSGWVKPTARCRVLVSSLDQQVELEYFTPL